MTRRYAWKPPLAVAQPRQRMRSISISRNTHEALMAHVGSERIGAFVADLIERRLERLQANHAETVDAVAADARTFAAMVLW